MTDQNTPIEISIEEARGLAEYESVALLIAAMTSPTEAIFTTFLLQESNPELAAVLRRVFESEMLPEIAADPAKVVDEQKACVAKWVERHREMLADPLAGATRRKERRAEMVKKATFVKRLQGAKSLDEAIEAAKEAGIEVQFVGNDEPGHEGHNHGGPNLPTGDLLN